VITSIVAATDFSTCADRALGVASAWARRLGAKLEVVHVVEHATASGPNVEPGHTDTAEVRLAQAVERARAEADRSTGVLLSGRPYEAIAAHASATHADVVVVGARGAGLIERALLGTVTDRVLRTAPCSVLVVPETTAELVPRVIVLPTDFSAVATAAVDRGMTLAKRFGATVEVVHAWEWPPHSPRQGGMADDIAGAALTRVRAAHPTIAGVVAHHHARECAATEAILQVAAETHADLVAMAPTGQHHLGARLLGGVTDHVVRSSTIPVLVLRVSAPPRAQ